MRKEKAQMGFAQRSKDRATGKDGAPGFVRTGAKYRKTYRFRTHGLTPEKAAEQIRKIEARHAIKEAKLDEMQTLANREFSVNLERFRIGAVVIRDRGEEDCEIVMTIARLVGGRWTRPEGLPIRRIVGKVDRIPDLATIEQIARGFAERIVLKEIDQQEFEAELAQLLAEG